MAKIELRNVNEKNVCELGKELPCTMKNLYYNGQYVCTAGVTSEQDEKKMVESFEKAIGAANGNLYEAIMMMQTLANFTDNDVKPTEEVEVAGGKLYVDYKARKIVGNDGKAVATLEDLGDVELPDATIKTLLVTRAEANIALQRQAQEAQCCGDCDDCDYDDCDDIDEDDIDW